MFSLSLMGFLFLTMSVGGGHDISEDFVGDLFDDLETSLDFFDVGHGNGNFTTESQLCVPQDNVEDLEWFPNFTDDYIALNGLCLTPERNSLYPGEFKVENTKTENSISLGYFDKQVEGKKKHGIDCTTTFTVKKQRSKRRGKHCRKRAWSTSSSNLYTLAASYDREPKRKCSHCLTDKTPQWRIGPLGPKTLCNACGVRYKSGRLVPEYRPAASPYFDSMKHSNFHKKILKKKKGMVA
ncbi:GATA transcription factor 9-like [Tripterygium wilfordii]|uniref:GATA transcription factor 9-like n=1 Tax=Tripterygium wilfordii TaxID=458696 RepID=A0A7J7DFH3_TRIWF|nr:GATA transcription factor 2-like [Tripterygium wilfordii]KAF5745110.1 GATA transcription factor 9-like [Tripterygium wilfordii]